MIELPGQLYDDPPSSWTTWTANVAEALALALQWRRDEGEALPARAHVTVAPVTVAAA